MQDWSPTGLLTGMPTRQDFLAALDQLVRTPTKRPHAHLGALALLAVDNVEHAVRRLGDAGGDRLLGEVAATVRETVITHPGPPLAARVGDEFGILAAGTTAQALADRLRPLPTATPQQHTQHGRWTPTVSIGVCSVVAGEGLDRPLARAGQALIQAKAAGRAQIQVYDASTHQFAAGPLSMLNHIDALKRKVSQLVAEVSTDALTGVGNRRALDAWVTRMELTTGVPCEVLFVDIDKFHWFNHEHGVEAGDDALRRVAAALTDTSRVTDRVFRRSGDEFVIGLPNTTRADALQVAERHRQAVEALAIPHGGTPQTPIVTVSVCVATATGRSPADAIDEASRPAFDAKRRGGCNVVLET